MVLPGSAPIALNPLQWFATADGWLDWQLSPSLPDLFAQIKEVGFDAVATRIPTDLSPGAYAQRAQDAGLTLAPGTVAIRPTPDGQNAPTIEVAAQLAAAYGELGLTHVFIFTGMDPAAARVAHPAQGFEADPDRLGFLADLLGRIGEVTTAAGVLPILHPHVGTWVETEDETRTILDAVPEELLGFGPDIGHLSWAGADVVGLVRDYAPRIGGLHVKDMHRGVASRSRAEGLTYQQTVLAGLWTEPGRGDIEYEPIWDALGEDFTGPIVIEVDRGEAESPFESARLCARWARGAQRLSA